MSDRPVPANAILSVVDELRRQGSLEQVPDAIAPGRAAWLQPGYTPEQGGLGFGDAILRAAWERGLLEGGGVPAAGERRRVTLKPEPAIAAIVRQLEAEFNRDLAEAKANGAFVTGPMILASVI